MGAQEVIQKETCTSSPKVEQCQQLLVQRSRSEGPEGHVQTEGELGSLD